MEPHVQLRKLLSAMKIHILSATTFLEYFHLISIQHSNLIKVLFCKKDTEQVLKYPSMKSQKSQNRQDYFEINVAELVKYLQHRKGR